MTIRDIALAHDRTEDAVRKAAKRLIARGVLPAREGRDYIFDERAATLVAGELVGRGGPGRKRAQVKPAALF